MQEQGPQTKEEGVEVLSVPRGTQGRGNHGLAHVLGGGDPQRLAVEKGAAAVCFGGKWMSGLGACGRILVFGTYPRQAVYSSSRNGL